MYAAVIGASSESIYAIQRATQMGISVIALDGNPDAPGLQYAYKSFVVDIKNLQLVYDILDPFSPEIVIPVPIGRYLTSVGAVNDHCHLRGVTQNSAFLCTDKHLFHDVLSRRNMRNIEHILISSGEEDVAGKIDSMRYPLVAKPRYGSGNRSVQVYQNHSDLRNHFLVKLPFDEDFIIENYLEGVEYGVDAAMINGIFHLVLLREKRLTPFPYRQCVRYYSIKRNDANTMLFKYVGEAVNNAGQILGFDDCLLHADILYNGKEVFIIEMAARPSGHHLHELFTPMATGVDMIAEYLKFSLPQLKQTYSFTPAYTDCLLIQYFDFPEGRIAKIPDKEYIYGNYPVKAYECHLKNGMVLQQAADDSLMRRGYYVIEGKDRNDLDMICDEIRNLYTLEKI